MSLLLAGNDVAARARQVWAATVGAQLRPRSEAGKPWYTVARSEAAPDDDGPASAEVFVRGVIGGIWEEDTPAARFVDDLRSLDVAELRVRINSPGGYVSDGVEIYNALRDHPAMVHVVVDSQAASAASFITMAGDRVTMNRGAEMMIHDAWGGVVGNATELRAYADYLERQTRKAAGFYAAKAGGTTDEWFELMNDAESWFTAAEAVDAGLADDAVELDEAAEKNEGAAARLPYRFQGRAEAPAPKVSTDTAPEAVPTHPAADEAAGREAAARQRRDQVDAHRATLARTTTPRRRTR